MHPLLSGNVLLLEDNELNASLVAQMLGQVGVDVECASDGATGLARAITNSFDLILMDCQMPVMDGYEATLRIRAHEQVSGRPSTPIIAVTAHTLIGDREKCLSVGMSDFMSKPYTFEQLYSALTRWLPPRPLRDTVKPS